MPRRTGHRGVSVFSALPKEIKWTLRSNPSVDSAPAEASNYTPNAADLLPTQPPSEDGDEEDGEDGEDGEDEAEAEAGDVQPERHAPGNVGAPSQAPQSGASSTTVVATRKRNGEALASPSKRQRPNGHAAETETDTEERHAWDCTGLVPRYENAKEVPSHLKKYFFQRHSLFPAYTRLPLLLDDTGWFSVTPAALAEHIAERCRCDVILDAFCGVGGNAIAFARTCERVIAMDNDLTRLRIARHNALHYGVADRIEFVLADYIEWAKEYQRRGAHEREEIDVVFLSPPWGGPEYLSFGEGTPSYPLSAVLPIPGDELFHLSTPITPNIAYFLPRNVDVEEVSQLANSLSTPENDAVDGERRDREWVEVEEEWVGDKLKAVTAYYGGLVEA